MKCQVSMNLSRLKIFPLDTPFNPEDLNLKLGKMMLSFVGIQKQLWLEEIKLS